MRRKSSGRITTSEAQEIWEATKAHEAALSGFQATLVAQVDKLRLETTRLAADYDGMRTKWLECESRSEELRSRIVRVESDSNAAAIIAMARVEADRIRAEAKLAKEAVEQEAVVVKDALEKTQGAS